MSKTIEVNIPSCNELYDSLPPECKDKYVKIYSDDKLCLKIDQALRLQYNRIIAMMINECKDAIKPVIYMSLFSQDNDNQRICNWSASDNNRPLNNEYAPRAGQNTSRWLYAGCLLYDMRDNTFSIHT